MTSLHLPTAYFLAGFLYLVMPTAIWMMLRKQAPASNNLWCWGGLSFGLALILLGLRDQLHDALTHGVAICLVLLGPLLRATALRRELGRPLHLFWIFLTGVLFTAVYSLLHSVLHNDSLRFVWSSLCVAVAFAWLASLAKEIGQREHSVSAQWIYIFYSALALVLALRVPSVLLGFGEPTAMTDDPMSALLICLAVFTSVVGNIGFLGMVLERINSEALELAKAQARREEAARLSEQIAQLDRRRSVGEIAASLAHELSQPLTNLYLITDRMALSLQQRQDSTLDSYFADLNRNTQKAGDILNRIRTYIQAKNTRFERVELSQIITDVSALIQDLAYNESVDLKVTAPKQRLAVQADPVQLSQIFMNVMRNAIQATDGQAVRQLHIRVWREGNMAHITLTDNGPGLCAEAVSQAGTAFFTTKKEGLGVGLSISKSIAQQHGGSLSIQNNPLGGAVVELQLPALA